MELVYCVDWLTASFDANIINDKLGLKQYDKNELVKYIIKEVIKIDIDLFVIKPGRFMFKSRLEYAGVEILFDQISMNGTSNIICLNVSGSGCRVLENNDSMFHVLHFTNEFHLNVTRLDLAVDDRVGILNLNTIFNKAVSRSQPDRCYWWGGFKVCNRIQGDQGTTIYFGSAKSLVRIRIYDKAKESNLVDTIWNRVETVFRDCKAIQVLNQICNDNSYQVYSSILRGLLIFTTKPISSFSESNESRQAEDYICNWWTKLLNGGQRVTLSGSTQRKKNWNKTRRYVNKNLSKTLAIYSEVLGGTGVLAELALLGREKLKNDDRIYIKKCKQEYQNSLNEDDNSFDPCI